MRQLLHNLLKNAVEALVDHEAGRVLVRTELRISDNGPGIPHQVRERLFEPYMTTKPRGTGLGLAIVRKIVEEHGGMIDIKEPRSGGVSISVRLPTAARPDSAAADGAPPQSPDARRA